MKLRLPVIKSHFQINDRRSREREFLTQVLQQRPVCQGLWRLLQAHNSAIACGRDPWKSAVGISSLKGCGIDDGILRMMICQKWVIHLVEILDSSDFRVEYKPESNEVFSGRSCFVLTPEGLEIAESLATSEIYPMNDGKATGRKSGRANFSTATDGSPYPTPCWDRERRELRIGNVVVKRFRWPADNQEQVLSAFEEEGWPSRIDDPLIPNPGVCPKRRLHDTLKCLNRKQLNEAIKFRGDGTGQGVLLEINWPLEKH